jgi:hypothetical protein
VKGGSHRVIISVAALAAVVALVAGVAWVVGPDDDDRASEQQVVTDPEPEPAEPTPAPIEWRPIATPNGAAVEGEGVWTGKELVVWWGPGPGDGGRPAPEPAAYDPVTDSWRILPQAPGEGHGALGVWSGSEVVYLLSRISAAPVVTALDPGAGTWRRIGSSSPAEPFPPSVSWAGERLIVVDSTPRDQNDAPRLASLEPATGRWRTSQVFAGQTNLTVGLMAGNDDELFMLAPGRALVSRWRCSSTTPEPTPCRS